ncbi:brain protein I3-like [Dreissena polymorpha]|uniref:Membrane protein BRI3 n=1 Tax=Dreissena polymorpha TaxID=45954 RepID=A0A9D4RH93_DREPO|nr:brain protein I3-like [Dreissena polymorpha]KAH3866492.1 hypothetical protein DPMN_029556 [Dreissena polymorpha]
MTTHVYTSNVYNAQSQPAPPGYYSQPAGPGYYSQPAPQPIGQYPYTQAPNPHVQNMFQAQQNTTVAVISAGNARTGNCPHCGQGILIKRYSTCGILLAILLFPVGVLFCLCMEEKRCTHCNCSF